jgi:DNA-damage-inducible protein J
VDRSGLVNAVVKASIDEQTVKEAEAVLQSMGLSTSAVVNLLIVRIAKDKALPFQPNAETIEAIEAARRGELATVPDGRLIESLNEDD